MTEQDLYEKLYKLRDRLRTKFYSNGRKPNICSNAILYELSTQAPRHKEDLLSISGLGKTFVDKYGDYFMKVLNQYHMSNVSTTELKTEVRNTLKNLENRLVNISKRNRLLYMSKIYNKYAFDMFTDNEEFNQSVIKLLFGRISKLKICSVGDQSVKEKRLKRLLPLLREVSKDYRESGQYDLYIGYPFVVGNTKGEDFNVRAPLAIFPIIFERMDDEVVLKLDKSKDILYNNNLILMQNKFLSKSNELPNNVIEDLKSYNFLGEMKYFYETNGINLTGDGLVDSIEKFEDIAQKDFPKFVSGEFHIVSNAILGKFSLYSSALQKDFKDMIEDTEINSLLDDLLSNIDTIDIYDDDIFDDDAGNKIGDFLEKDINYINELNASQEQAILDIDKDDKLVIQGPPGTGKSQTITSLIADAVNKGKNVVMVSQKKAALDVIYSRLGDLSNYAIILNDTKDKSSFYNQIGELFYSNKTYSYVKEYFEQIANRIDDNINNLKVIADKLYSHKTNGIETYKIYQDNDDNQFKVRILNEDIYYECINAQLLNVDYMELKSIKDKFLDETLLNTIFNYIELSDKFAWLNDMRDIDKTIEVKEMQRLCNEFAKNQVEYLGYNFFKRLFNKGKRNKELKKIYKAYFKNSKSRKLIFKNPQILIDGIKNYSIFRLDSRLYNQLSENEKLFAKVLYNMKLKDENIANSKNLFDFIVYCVIDQFESDNAEMFSNVGNFSSIITQISNLIAKKKELTKTKLKSVLVNAYDKEIEKSKRYLEICRQIESARRWSVTKFVKKFSYELFKGIKIWLMSPESVSEVLPLEKGLFDLLIFDEASQIYIERGIPAISRARKVVIAGDHKQLRPSSLGVGRIDYDEDEELDEDEQEANAALEEESLLDLARFKYPSVLLNYHYRSRYEELINFSNYAFYHGRLNISPNIEKPSEPPIQVIKIDNGTWVNRCNKNEAIKVVETIKDFLFSRQNKETLGVITFNSSQRDMIMDVLDDECAKDQRLASIVKKEFDRKENGEDVGLFVKNIENVQGDERDCIIFSIGYAKNNIGKVVRNFGWLNQQGGENRLNVAISRAKKKIYVVTSISPDQLPVDDLKNNGPKLFRKYLEYCWAINNRDEALVNSILHSFTDTGVNLKTDNTLNGGLETSLINELTNRGFIVHKNVGVAGYKIDIGVRDKNDKKYILGIECDSKLYNSDMCTRERDIYRQTYLESRGWRIYRLWSTNWWHNKEKEIENIVSILSIEEAK